MVVFPSALTEEEEALQKKYAKLKKKVRHEHFFVYSTFYFFGSILCVQPWPCLISSLYVFPFRKRPSWL